MQYSSREMRFLGSRFNPFPPRRGRVVAVTDAGWIGNAALQEQGGGATSLQPHDNWEIFRRLARWAAHLPEAPAPAAS